MGFEREMAIWEGLWESDSPTEPSVMSLLNCYCREVAIPNRVAFVGELGASLGLRVLLPRTDSEIRIRLRSRPSLTGGFDFIGSCLFKGKKDSWVRLGGLELALKLTLELSASGVQISSTPDLIENVSDSVRVSNLISRLAAPVFPRSFIEGEQSLFYGHPFHPSPKSRLGFSDIDVESFSPEFKKGFALRYFAVKKQFLIHDSILPQKAPELLEDSIQPFAREDEFLVPLHPWQARRVSKFLEVQSAMATGSIRDLGTMGPIYFATSSVRTVYSSETEFSLKLSLYVRITNCFRRNSLVELKSALEVTRLLNGLKASFSRKYPDFVWLDEPSYLTVDLKKGDLKNRDRISENFGVMFRAPLPEHTGVLPIVAASIFGNGSIGRRFLSVLVKDSGYTEEEWFRIYLEKLLPPLLELYFENGIMFEPHLQNIIIGIREGVAHQIFVRDMDNVRFLPGSRIAQEMNPDLAQVSDGILLSESLAQDRFVYCLVVNHLCEAIFQLSLTKPGSERKLWKVLESFFVKNGFGKVFRQSSLPAKANLVTRFQRTPDRNAKFVGIPNPMMVGSKL